MKNNLSYFWQKKTILSFVAVFFVVIIHTSATAIYDFEPNTISNFTIGLRNFLAYDLGAVAVPLFFFLSGFAFFRNFTLKEYSRKLKSRSKTLLRPYLFWNIFGMLIIILCTFTPLSNLISSRETFEPSLNNIFEGIFLYKYNFQFWFLYDLIIYVILSPLIYFLIYYKHLGALSLLGALILPNFIASFAFLNFHFTIFFILGGYLGRHFPSFFAKAKSTKFAIMSGIISLCILIVNFLSIYNIWSQSVIVSQSLLVILLLSLWFFSDLFIPKLKPKKYTNEFFPIYTLHTYFLAIVTKAIFFLLPKTPIIMLTNELLSPVATMAIVTIIAYFWHQKLPRSYNLLFGNN